MTKKKQKTKALYKFALQMPNTAWSEYTQQITAFALPTVLSETSYSRHSYGLFDMKISHSHS